MLSILIPIYNENVVELVRSLQDQCIELQLKHEIICIDDCSEGLVHQANKHGLPKGNIKYQRLTKNIGRSRIRNKLIEASAYDLLLCIDADHKIVSKDYIKSYSRHFVSDEFTLLYGGTVYPDKTKIKRPQLLHWNYGSIREVIPANNRSLQSANHVHTNNLLINKTLLGNIRFDESIQGYGYEDILFAQEVDKKGKTIKHIDNPLMHLGLKSNTDFLLNLKEASNNLAILYTGSKIMDLKIIRYYKHFKQTGLLKPLVFLLRSCENLLFKALKVKPQFLFLVDGLRLLYFAQAVETHHKSQKED